MMKNNLKLGIIITAAGSSTRIGGSVKKEYLPFKNGTVLSNCAIAFLKALTSYYEISNFVITCPVGGIDKSKNAVFCDKVLTDLLNINSSIKLDFVEGGDSRQKSVFNALEKVKQSEIKPDIILIHDGARPFVTKEIILDVVTAASKYGASVPGVTPIDTQKEIDADGFVVRHLVRKNLCAVQTPQGFNFIQLYEAHKKAQNNPQEFTDDTEIWGAYCGAVKTVKGDVNNIKITYPSDLERL